MASVNHQFNAQQHMELVNSPAFEGKALCVLCGHTKLFAEFQPDAVEVWKATDNPHRIGHCKGCTAPSWGPAKKGMFFHLKRMLRLV